MAKLKSIAVNAFWKMLWPETFNDFQGFPSQQVEIGAFHC
jgi:hypothetical protein